MIVLFIVRSALQPGQDSFKTGIVAAIHGNAPEGFHEGCEQSSGFRRLLCVQGLHGAAAQVFRQLIRPKGFDNRRQFIQSGGNKAPCGSFCMLDAARIIQDDVARFATRSVGAGFGELPQRMAQCRNGNAPHVGAAQHSRFFTRRKFQPELIDKLFAVRVRRPGNRERREMLRGVRTGIPPGLDDDVAQARDCRPDR